MPDTVLSNADIVLNKIGKFMLSHGVNNLIIFTFTMCQKKDTRSGKEIISYA